MRRSGLTLPVLLAVACADGPTAPDVARAPPNVGLTEETLAAINRLLGDPFVHDVIAEADQTAQNAIQDVMDRVASGEPQAILRALTGAHSSLHESSDDEAVVAHSALRLTLSAVQTLLDTEVQAQTNENEAVPTGRLR